MYIARNNTVDKFKDQIYCTAGIYAIQCFQEPIKLMLKTRQQSQCLLFFVHFELQMLSLKKLLWPCFWFASRVEKSWESNSSLCNTEESTFNAAWMKSASKHSLELNAKWKQTCLRGLWGSDILLVNVLHFFMPLHFLVLPTTTRSAKILQ